MPAFKPGSGGALPSSIRNGNESGIPGDSITQIDFHNKLIMLAIKLLHFGLSLVLFALAWLLFRYYGTIDANAPGFRYNVFAVLLYGCVEFFLLRTYSSYLLGYSRIRTLIAAQTLSRFFSIAIFCFVVSVAWNRFNGTFRELEPRLQGCEEIFVAGVNSLSRNDCWDSMSNR